MEKLCKYRNISEYMIFNNAPKNKKEYNKIYRIN